MLKNHVIAAIAVAGLAAGCTSVQDVRTVEPTGSAFTQALTKEYRDLAVFEADQMSDWRDASYFADKGLAAAQGNVVDPTAIEERDVPADALEPLQSARLRLVSALGQARNTMPDRAARAQVKYDCWIEQQEENFQYDHISACRDELMAILGEIEQAAAPAPTPQTASTGACDARSYLIFFDFDDSTIRVDGDEILSQVLEDLRTPECSGAQVTIIGHTDTKGSNSYNQALSLRRADNVVSRLIAAAISPARITATARGEEAPRVPTADEVEEQENRRVEVNIQ